jgi:hypothetical protein
MRREALNAAPSVSSSHQDSGENFPLLLAPPAPPSFHSRAGSAYGENNGIITSHNNGWAVQTLNNGAPSKNGVLASAHISPHSNAHAINKVSQTKDVVFEDSLGMHSIESSTQIFRSMEFEHPVFVQNPSANKSLRPPYYPSTKAEEFDRAVADSMPELSHARSYHGSDILPPRVRRKSETCV